MIGSLIDNSGIWLGEKQKQIGTAVGGFLEEHPGAALAAGLFDAGVTALGGPLKYAVGQLLDYTKDSISGWVAGKMEGPKLWTAEKAQAGGDGAVLAASIAITGLGALRGASGMATGPAAAEGTPSWRLYEQRYGGQQTSMTTTFNGEEVAVRLDKAPTGSRIVDFKDYDWSNPAYDRPFIQDRVRANFQAQIEKYQTIRPNVELQFSQPPPAWAVKAIKDAGGTHSVKP